MSRKPKTSPQDHILDAAERAFAEHGFEGASLREIVRQAGVNLATVYYYFESKEALMAAVIERRFAPLREDHLDRLRQCEAQARGRPVPLEQILEALLRPPLRLAATSMARSQTVMRLVGRLVTEPNPQFQDLLRRRNEKVRAAFVAALGRSLPDLSLADLHWRLEFVWGALAFVLCNPRKIEKMSRGACNPADTEAVLAQMRRFFAAGFRAPAASRP